MAPRPRSARWLAHRFEVSARTIERDVSALQQSAVPIWAEAGRTGGYCLDKARTLPPVNPTPDEAVAMAVALQRMDGTPFRLTAASALRKLVAAMPKDDATAAQDLAARVHLLGPEEDPLSVPHLIAGALSSRRVLRIVYALSVFPQRSGIVEGEARYPPGRSSMAGAPRIASASSRVIG